MAPGSPGFSVDVAALRGYAEDLGDYQDQGTKFTDLVGRADVGDRSWGLVGLATKGGYTETLHALRSLLADMTTGFGTAAGKITDCAETYQGNEDDHSATFHGMTVQLDGPRP